MSSAQLPLLAVAPSQPSSGTKGLQPPLSSSILSSFAYHTAILLIVYEWVGQSGVLDRFYIGWRQKVTLYFLPLYIELRFRSLSLVDQRIKHRERRGKSWGSYRLVLSSLTL
jgi:hypothetical protein